MNRKRLYSLLLGLFLGLVLIALWMSYTELDIILQKIRSVNPGLVAAAALIYISAYFIRSVRWNFLTRNTVRMPIARTWLYSMGGNFVNYMIPIRLGELVKAWFIKRNHGLSISAALPSIFIDKSFDTVGIFFVLLMLPFLAVELSVPMLVLLSLLGLVFVLSLALILMAALHQEKVLKLLGKLLAIFPSGLQGKINSFLEIFIRGLNIFEHHWSILLLAVGLTALGIALDGLYFYLLFRAFGIGFSYVLVLFGYTLINLSYALPQPPAQLGSNEWMMIIIFSVGFGLTKDSASAIMVFAHVLTALIMAVLGIISFSISGLDVLKAVYKDETKYD